MMSKCAAARLTVPLLLSLASLSARAAEEASAKLTFEEHVRPILKAYCFDCHGAEEKLRGSLDLRLRRFIASGGDSGAAIEPGDAGASLLYQRVRDGEMPPGEKKVPAEQIEIIRQWIDAGAETLRDEPETLPTGPYITPEERAYWAFQPIQDPPLPETSAEDRVRTPIDALLLAQMKPKGLHFSPDADRLTLLRRAAMDLTGLPPTQEEIDRFLSDTDPEAYERMLDRLLDSPHYGERWARHWLDAAGYADSDGATLADSPRPYAYKYRDYIIRALNADMPLDQFIIEQLAGDELAGPQNGDLTPEQTEKLIATGLLRMAADGTGSGAADPELAKNQVIADTLKILGTSLLGLTVQCAQCHDHRYDPIPQEDYFRLRAIFEPALDWKQWRTPSQRLVSLYTAADRAKAEEIEAEAAVVAAERTTKQAEYMAAALAKELEKYPQPLRDQLNEAYHTPADKRTPEQQQLLDANPSVKITPGVLYQYNQAAADDLKKYDEKIAAIRARKPVEDFIQPLTEIPGQIPTTHIFYRGDHRQPTEPVKPGALTICSPEGQRLEIAEDDPQLPTSGRRLAYARYLTSGTHPLLTRVLVNRVWLNHFGRGIVDTPGDFGVLGQRPTHPELLDWLALELVRQDWSLKRLHKRIMMSTVYRQQSVRDPAQQAIDAENFYYWRMPVRRLEAEALRDRILAASGELDRTMFGPPIPVTEDDVGQVVTPKDKPRRSIYLQVRRSKPVSLLAAFDAPVMETNCERRSSSTVAPQSLMLMNSEFLRSSAETMARRLARETTAPLAAELAAVIGNVDLLRPAAAWSYGYGRYDAMSQRVSAFQPLANWTESHWQAGAELPDPQAGWVMLHASGGHPGNDEHHAAIRRWTAPRAGRLSISGQLSHSSPHGDGVRGRIVSSRSGLLLEVSAKTSDVATSVDSVEVQAGDTIDLVVDCQETVTSDSFGWGVVLALADADGTSLGQWNCTHNFRGPEGNGPPLAAQIAHAWQLAYQRPIRSDELPVAIEFTRQQLEYLRTNRPETENPELAVMTNLCQSLMASNEFLYVD